MDVYSSAPRRRDRLVVHVYTPDRRHVQVALYGWSVDPGPAAGQRRTATWEAAVYADSEEPLTPTDEERWRDDLAAAVITRNDSR